MNQLEKKRVALIGGAGFIGHNLALGLHQRGYAVDVIDSLQVNNLLAFTSSPTGHSKQNDLYLKMINSRLDLLRAANIPLHILDAREYHGLSHCLNQIKPQIIVQLAAIAHANKSNKDPHSTFDHSLRTLENALDYARGAKVERFVYFSSSMVYGNFQKPEVLETEPLNPIGIYGALKLAGEKITIAYQQVFDLPYTIIRPSALYGARCVSRRVGQIFIENALEGLPLRIEGDGVEKVDFTYIDDLIQGVCLALERPEGINQTFNITYGNARSIKELADIVVEHFPGSKIENIKRDKLMPFRGTLSIQKARDLLGFNPQNPIEVGFAKYIEFYRELLSDKVSV